MTKVQTIKIHAPLTLQTAIGAINITDMVLDFTKRKNERYIGNVEGTDFYFIDNSGGEPRISIHPTHEQALHAAYKHIMEGL